MKEMKKVDYIPRSRYSVEQWVAGEKKSFETYAREVVHLERMKRDCGVRKTEKGGRKRMEKDKPREKRRLLRGSKQPRKSG